MDVIKKGSCFIDSDEKKKTKKNEENIPNITKFC